MHNRAVLSRLRDVLWMFRWAALRAPDTDSLTYQTHVVTNSVIASIVQLRAVGGPGNEAEPVITIMLPDED